VHVGYCEEYSYSFRLFFDAWSESSWNSLFVLKEQKFQSESSWNIRSQGTKVPLHESSTGTKVPSVNSSLPVTKVQRNETSDILRLKLRVRVMISTRVRDRRPMFAIAPLKLHVSRAGT